LVDLSRTARFGGEIVATQSRQSLARALESLDSAIESSGARVTVAGNLPEVLADGDQLEQVFFAILENALKFRSRERAPVIEVGCEIGGANAQFRISDNGIGIQPRYLEQIFRLFARLHKPSEYAGTGIGLSLCARVIRRHGGTIWAESEPGRGSTFFFTIPMASPTLDTTSGESAQAV